MNAPAKNSGCSHVVDRRAFLADASVIAMALLAQLGVSTRVQAQSLGVVTAEPIATGGLSYAIPLVDGAAADVANKILVVRANNTVYAFSLACPHRGALMVWHGDESRVYCPKHKAQFTPDGTHDRGRASRNLDRHAIRREGARLVVDTSVQLRADLDTPAWTAAVIKLSAA